MPVAIIPAALAAFQIGKGIVDSNNAKKAAKEAQAQIKPYKTPQEVIDVLNATKYNAQSGFDPQTLSFLTDQSNNAFAGTLGTVQRLGGDPNALSYIFGQQVDNLKQISAQNHQQQMANFSAYINAENAMAANDAAQQKSVQDQLKDQLQKIAIDKQVATQQISSGINTGLSALSNYQMSKLYDTNYGQYNTGNTYIPQTTNSTGYLPNTIGSQNFRQTGLQIPQ